MTSNGEMALILRYFTEFCSKKNSRSLFYLLMSSFFTFATNKS